MGKKSLIDMWRDFVSNKSDRPNGTASYGSGMDKVTIRLPKSIQEQAELVEIMLAMDTYPHDWAIRKQFIEKILKNTSYLSQEATWDNMGLDGIIELTTMYQDLLLRPLLEAAGRKMERTIMSLLPAAKSTE